MNAVSSTTDSSETRYLLGRGVLGWLMHLRLTEAQLFNEMQTFTFKIDIITRAFLKKE